MAVRIITDSAADFEPEELQQKDVVSVPLTITFGDTSYQDGFDLSKQEFYNKLLAGSDFPMTSQPSPEMFLEHFKEAEEQGDSVVAILLSGGLSGTVQSANLAKNMLNYKEIYIVDSLSAVAGLRLMLDKAIQMRDAGDSAKSIYEAMMKLVGNIRIVCMVDSLEYLHRGGRLTKTQARLGSLANLKPIISINEEGKLFVLDKCLGKAKAYKRIMSQVMEKRPADHSYPYYFIYSNEKANCERLIHMLKQEVPSIDENAVFNIGPTIGAHLGNGAFGIVYVEKK